VGDVEFAARRFADADLRVLETTFAQRVQHLLGTGLGVEGGHHRVHHSPPRCARARSAGPPTDTTIGCFLPQ
jgi:hypothetical protein